MANVAEAIKTILKAGLTPTYTGSLSTGSNYQFLNDGRTYIHIINGGGSPDTVTVVSQAIEDGLAVADLAVVVPAGEERVLGPFNTRIYNDASGLLNFGHSFITSVTQGVYRLQ